MRKLKMPKISLDQQPNVREKIFFLIAMAGLLLLFVNTLWEPISMKMNTTRQELVNVRLESDTIKRLVESTKSQLRVQQSVPKRRVKVDEKVKKMLERKIVDPLSEVHSVMGIISSKKFSGKVKIDDVNIGEMEEKDNYWMVPISLQVTSRYGGMRSFFGALEKIDRPIVVQNFDLRESSEGRLIKGSIDVVLYIVKS